MKTKKIRAIKEYLNKVYKLKNPNIIENIDNKFILLEKGKQTMEFEVTINPLGYLIKAKEFSTKTNYIFKKGINKKFVLETYQKDKQINKHYYEKKVAI